MATADLKFDFMGYRKIAAIVSVVLVLGSIASLALVQLNWGLDFTGGSLIEVEYEEAANPESIRQQLIESGFEGHVVQHFGSDRDILIRVPPQKSMTEKENAELGTHVLESLQAATSETLELRRSEFVGPVVGEELTNQGAMGMLTALAIVMLYIANLTKVLAYSV